MRTKTISLAGAAALTFALCSTVVPAQAATTCSLNLGSVTAAGAQTARTITATAPVTVGAVTTTAGVYQPGSIQHISTFRNIPSGTGAARSGLTVHGNALYSTAYSTLANGQVDPAHPVTESRIGGGWSAFRWIDESIHNPVDPLEPRRTTLYAQDTSGFLRRWTLDETGWHGTGGIGGLSAAKSMTLIAREFSYDIYLLNNRAGRLMTVMVFGTYPMSTYGTTLRTSTWQVFEQLIAAPCGAGSLILGIDRDTQSATLYSMAHVNGTATVIKNLGKVPGTFTDPHYFRYTPRNDTLRGQ
ncbi:hypothetical protein [Kribbella sp. NPDC051620]|uniref:hypothetical protein n=1 Tax=Kribbella sp. NPDC051620 TaxID=3364120 RepID=UPI0037965980